MWERLKTAVATIPADATCPTEIGALALLGHCTHYGLVEEDEAIEVLHSVDKDRRVVIPCYLYTHVRCPELRRKLDAYVRCYSRMWRSGCVLSNLTVRSAVDEVIDALGGIAADVASLERFAAHDGIARCYDFFFGADDPRIRV